MERAAKCSEVGVRGVLAHLYIFQRQHTFGLILDTEPRHSEFLSTHLKGEYFYVEAVDSRGV